MDMAVRSWDAGSPEVMELGEQIKEAARKAEKHRALADRHYEAQKRHQQAGKAAEADRAACLYLRARSTMERAYGLVKRLERRQARVIEADRVRLLARRAKPSAPDSAPTPESVKQAKELRKAGLDVDPRTAAGQRHYEIVDLGHSKRAQVGHLTGTLKRRADRTPERVLAWTLFEEHMHAIMASGIPAQSLERIGGACTTGDMAASKLHLIGYNRALRAHLGVADYGLLQQIVGEGRTLSDVATTPRGVKPLSMIFKRALDQAARFFGHPPGNGKGRQRAGTPTPPTPPEIDASDQ
jgi:hypothetical protein